MGSFGNFVLATDGHRFEETDVQEHARVARPYRIRLIRAIRTTGIVAFSKAVLPIYQ
jgi:hypothetical protein